MCYYYPRSFPILHCCLRELKNCCGDLFVTTKYLGIHECFGNRLRYVNLAYFVRLALNLWLINSGGIKKTFIPIYSKIKLRFDINLSAWSSWIFVTCIDGYYVNKVAILNLQICELKSADLQSKNWPDLYLLKTISYERKSCFFLQYFHIPQK